MKRTVIALFTACALLTQGAAWAVTATSMAFPVMADKAELPCHGDDEAPAAQKQSPCCGETCDCPELCAGHAAVVTPVLALATQEHSAFESPRLHDLQLSVLHPSPLRPPIAL